jgi:hypothetical protein
MADLNEQALNITRVQTHKLTLGFNGLLPRTKHILYMDGVDHSFASRQMGKEPGDDIISDANGEAVVEFYYEVPFARDQNFELPQTPSLSFQESVLSDSRRQNLVTNVLKIELKSSNEQSYAQYLLNLDLLLTGGPLRTQFPIE